MARDGVEALETLLGTEASTFDLALIDIHLPRQDGFEVMAQVQAGRRTASERPLLLILSGSARGDDWISARASGTAIMRKPVDTETLRAILLCLETPVRQTVPPSP